MSGAMQRRRVVTWEDTASAAHAWRTMSGIDYLRAMVSGAVPRAPFSALVGLGAREIEPGRATMTLTPAEYLYNPLGSVHGGIIATLLDSAMACAVHSTLPAGRGCTTIEIKVNYLRALTEAVGEVMAEGTLVQAGRQIAAAEGRVIDARGRLYATASSNFLKFDMPENKPSPASDGAERRWDVAWSDPAATAQAGLAMAGADYLAAMRDGALPPPPVVSLLGITLNTVEPGRVQMTLPSGEHLYNPFGAVHGGMIATLLDSVMGCAVHSIVPQGRGYTTLEIKVSYLRPMLASTGSLVATGQVVHAGRQVSVAGGRAVDAAGRVYATASTTCLMFDARPPQ